MLRHTAFGKACRRLARRAMIVAVGRASEEGLGNNSTLPKGLRLVSPDPPTPVPATEMTRHSFLAALHERLRPKHYLEIGVDRGESLTLARCRSIGIDPGSTIDHPLGDHVQIVRETSDDFFGREDAFDHFEGPVDLAFIDGMHLAEFALRDFMNLEKHMSPGGVVVLDDMLPRNSLEAYRVRRTEDWTGDVYKVHAVLKRHRPDLTLIPVNTTPTGSYVIVGCDPRSTVLDEKYAELEPSLTGRDPQSVEESWLRRTGACDPEALLSSPAWGRLRTLREASADRDAYAEVWRRLARFATGRV